MDIEHNGCGKELVAVIHDKIIYFPIYNKEGEVTALTQEGETYKVLSSLRTRLQMAGAIGVYRGNEITLKF